MIRITNGKDIFEVTRGAFDGIYSRQGYTVLNETKPAEQNENIDAPKKTEEEIFVEEVIEKPISQWSKDELKRFAAIKGIDITGTKNASEAKELVKQFLSENE